MQNARLLVLLEPVFQKGFVQGQQSLMGALEKPEGVPLRDGRIARVSYTNADGSAWVRPDPVVQAESVEVPVGENTEAPYNRGEHRGSA